MLPTTTYGCLVEQMIKQQLDLVLHELMAFGFNEGSTECPTESVRLPTTSCQLSPTLLCVLIKV